MSLVIVGASQIASDIVDAAIECGIEVSRVLIDLPPSGEPRDLAWSERLNQWARHGVRPLVQPLQDYVPIEGETLLLGPTTPLRHRLVEKVEALCGGHPNWATLIHPAARVSRLSEVGQGCFIGAGAVIAPGVKIGQHVFVNRSVSVGHDTWLGNFVRIQPGANLGGLIAVERGVTIGLGACVIERLRVGAESVIAAGALVHKDVEPHSLVAGVPARFVKRLPALFVEPHIP